VKICDVVIVNFNAGKFLSDAVASSLQSSAVKHVFIVDNASTDKSLDLLPVKAGEQLTIVHNATNLGFAAACNIGLARSETEYILLLNPDCSVQPGAVERLIDVLRSSDSVGICGPLLLNPDGSEQAGGRRVVPTPWRSLVRVLELWRLRWLAPGVFSDFALHRTPLPDHPIDVDSISGACMMVRRAALGDVGPLDEEYFLHCEDLDWCMRFRQRGWRVVFVPDAKVVHEKGVSSANRLLITELHKHRGMIRFYRKFFRTSYPTAVFGLAIIGVWIRFIVIAVGIMLFNRRRG
jgi:GT2 family glycosyltransferase